MARKRAAEEKELKEASKNRKMVAESSQLLVAALEKLSNAATLAAFPEIGGIVEEKMGGIQKDMIEKLDEKLDDKFSSFLTVMQQMLEKKKNKIISLIISYFLIIFLMNIICPVKLTMLNF